MKNPYYKRSAGGVTLIELLLYVGISSTILLVASLSLASLLEARVKNEAVAEVEGQGQFVMQLITRSVRNGQSIIAPVPNATSTSLTLNVLNVAEDPTIISLSSGVIRLTQGASAAIALTNGRVVASGLTIENRSRVGTSGTVRISFTLSRVNLSGRNEFSYVRTFVSDATVRPN
jgi:type II secretory pathway pseudopilin PulG